MFSVSIMSRSYPGPVCVTPATNRWAARRAPPWPRRRGGIDRHVTGPRQPLSRTGVLRTAVAYADEHGLTGLTMRRLGEVLGVEAMSLYYHVNGRQDLLEGMVGEIVSAVHLRSEERRVGKECRSRWS